MKRLLVTGIGVDAVSAAVPLYPGHDITALVSTPPGAGEEIVVRTATLREHRMPRPQAWARECARLADKPGIDAAVVALARTAADDDALRRAFLRYAADADTIVHTSAALFDIDERCGADGKPRLYHAPAGPQFPRACETDPAGPFTWMAFPLWVAETRLVAACDRIETDCAAEFARWYDKADRKRRCVLVVNDYPVDYPGGGGHTRIRSLNRFLAADEFEVTLLCLTDAGERRDTVLAPHFRQIAVPCTPAHAEMKARMNRGCGETASDVVSLLSCADNPQLGQEFRAAAAFADLVIFEHVYLAPLARLLPPGVPLMYSAQNVESAIKRQSLAGHPHAAELCAAADAAEAFLLERVDAVTAVSPDDAAHFSAASAAPVHVVPNGVRIPVAEPSLQREGVVFTGTAHPPNVEALEFILHRIAPALPDTSFVVIGAVGENVSPDRVPVNVTLTGRIPEERKNELLANAAAAVNPMFSGGGSNMKLPEYFAWRLPVVSTPFGARGFDIHGGTHLLIAHEDRFVEALRELLGSAELRERLGRSAYEYARDRLDWTVLSRRWQSAVAAAAQARERRLSLRPVAGGVSAAANELELLFPASEALDGTFDVRWGDAAAEDGALRACTPASGDTERFLALFGRFADTAAVAGGPRSAVRRGARLLQMHGVPTAVAGEAPGEHWLAWSDALRLSRKGERE
jgi:glycosyltransferase involved in cell wall biosynthesis